MFLVTFSKCMLSMKLFGLKAQGPTHICLLCANGGLFVAALVPRFLLPRPHPAVERARPHPIAPETARRAVHLVGLGV